MVVQRYWYIFKSKLLFFFFHRHTEAELFYDTVPQFYHSYPEKKYCFSEIFNLAANFVNDSDWAFTF